MVDHDDITQIVAGFPETSSADGAWMFRGKGFAWVYNQRIPGQPGRTRRDDVVAVRVADLLERDALIASNPQAFFTDDHYRNFPAVLINLDSIELDELRELIEESWRLKAPKRLYSAYLAARPNTE